MNLQLFAMTDKFMIFVDDGAGGGGKIKSDKPKLPVKDNKGSGTGSDKASDNEKIVPETKKQNDDKKTNASVPEVKTVDDFKASDKAINSQKEADEALDYLTSVSTPTISDDVLSVLNSKFSVSSAYTEAMNYTNALLEKLSSGRTSYTDQIKDMMNQIQNREKFSYDVENDTLFQQALASAMGSGKQAMQDTIGQASALTGGYASTYATSAGNQAYNAYIEDAYNNLPEYYQMALDAYNMEGQEMYNQLNMLNQADATEYGRMYDSWSANFTNAQNMYNQEYGAWQDSVNNAYNNANLQLKQQGMIYDQAYNNYTALQGSAEILYSQEFDKWQSALDNAYRYDSMANSNEQNRLNREQDQNQFEASLNQDNAQFVARYDVNGDGVVNASDQIAESGGMSTLTERELNTVEGIYKNAGGGEEGFNAVTEYLESIGKSETDYGELDVLLAEADKAMQEAYVNAPVWEKNWSISDDTKNWAKGVDGNDVFTDGREEYTYNQLKKMLDSSGLTEKEKKEFLDKLYAQSKN